MTSRTSRWLPGRAPRRNGYSMIELIGCLALLSLLLGCFYATLQATNHLERVYSDETAAVVVLASARERLMASPNPTPETAAAILADEARRSGLASRDDLTPRSFSSKPGVVTLSIQRPGGKPLASLEVRL